jgi:recombination protein RecT
MAETPQKTEANAPVKKEISHSERFTNAVMKEYKSNAGEVELTSFQKKLIQNYFIKLDSVLKDAENKRLKKSEQYRDPTPLTWENVNMNKLAFEVVGFSSVGLDPLQPNHINLIPYKNNHNNNYDITGIIGYRGIELKATKYGFNPPDDVVVELVFSNDSFKMIKKDAENTVENYKLSIDNAFDRGTLVGGFYYHKYFDFPQRNKLRVFTVAEIEKRKPTYASVEFWGGEKDAYEKGKKTGKKETTEGYYLEMCYKTVFRAGYNDITIDSEKIETYIQQALDTENGNYHKAIDTTTEDIAHEVVDEVQAQTGTQQIEFEEPDYMKK